MDRIKLTFMDCKYAVHEECGIVVATVKFKFLNQKFSVQGKAKCLPWIFDEHEGKRLARARAERSAYIIARNSIKALKKDAERALSIVNTSLDFFNDCISHQDDYIDTF